MSLVPIEQIGQIGIIKDVKPYALEPNAWSDGNNVRFTDKGVQNIEGYHEVMAGCPIEPMHIRFYNRTKDMRNFWLAFGVNRLGMVGEIWCWDELLTEWKDVTPLDPEDETVNMRLSFDDNIKWSTDFLGVQLIATNGLDPMLIWSLGDDGVPSSDNRFEILDLQLSAEVEEHEDNIDGARPLTINSFKSILIGMNYPQGPTRVWWSSPGGHYTTPTWDYYNNDQDAGDYELNDTKGIIVDGAALDEAFLIYKSDSIYIASYIGRPFIFGFKALSKDVGLLTKNALCPFPGGHIFMSRYDVHITNGQQVTALLGDKLQGEIFNDINGDYFYNCFIAADHANTEAYICWPSSDSEWANRCITWNWVSGALGIRELPDLSDIKEGIVPFSFGIDTWEADYEGSTATFEWDTLSSAWGYRSFESQHPELLFASPPTKKLRRSGGGIHTIDGAPMRAEVERTGMDLGDPGSVKKVNAVWPRISTVGDTVVQIYVSGAMSPDDIPVWEGPFEFNPDIQSKISCRVTGKYFGWKIVSEGFMKWECHGVEFNVEPGGQRGSRIQ